MTVRVAVLVDGDNFPATGARAIDHLARAHRRVDVQRCYLNAQKTSGWAETPGYRLLHAGAGKNAADLLLSIDAMELAMSSDIGLFVLASSDGDFTHLATRLRERGLTVLGIGEAKAPAAFRCACSGFTEVQVAARPAALPKPAPKAPTPPTPRALPPGLGLDETIRREIARHSQQGKGMLITELAPLMHHSYGVKISEQPGKTWRAYFSARPHLFALDPKGQQSRVRFHPEGFLALVS